MYHGERLNSISHLVGTVLALVGLGALLTIAIQTRDPWIITSFTVFGLALVLLYTMSTLYHSLHPPALKRIFRVMDHIAIYLLIAGTYTPYMLVSLRDDKGWLIMGIVWALAGVGILTEVFLSGRAVKIGQLIIYLAMGWACSLVYTSLKAAIPDIGIKLLVAGGLAYTVGVVFYIIGKLKWLDHAHGIWHFFILTGSICHFISIIGYVR